MNIILFAQMGSGKDSVAQIFIDFAGYIKGKLGAEIRSDVDTYVKLMGIDDSERRRLYVEYGQGKRQMFGENIWCSILQEKVQDIINEGKLIIADARQINEYDYFVNRLGFIPIAIDTNEEIRSKRLIDRDGYDQSNQFHSDIEKQAKKVIEKIKADNGYVIYNNGTVDELIIQVKNLLDNIYN